MNNLEEKKKLSSQLKKNPQIKSNKITFYDYEVSDCCCNEDSFGTVCLKCGQCGRRFVEGILHKEVN